MQNNPIEAPAVALITGAARRIGAEIARVLHAEGLNIALHCHQSLVEAEALCAQLNQARPASAVIVQADLNSIAGLTRVIEEAVQAWGRLDVLINNASRFYPTPLGQIGEAAWQDLLNSNLTAPLFLSQAAAPHLAKQQGCIVNLADVHGERPMRNYAVYCITKAGIIMLTKSLAKELAPTVRVNAISPGETMWPEGDDNDLSDEDKNNILKRIPLKRICNVGEIAKAVVFLVKSADYVTGHVLAVDGGRSLKI